MNSENLPKIGISIGDINGIGPEVIITSLEDRRVYQNFTPVIYANGGLMSYFRKALKKENFNFHQASNVSQINPKKINIVNSWEDRAVVNPGKPDSESGVYARKSLEHAVSDLKTGNLDALVTAPISKEHMRNKGFEFPGHTEYLAQEFGGNEPLMLMVHDQLRVGVVTGHIPLSEVTSVLTSELIQSKVNILNDSLKNDFGIKKPRIALLGVNPHAGENGMLGNEENDIVIPVIEESKKQGHLVFGPYPADGFFGSNQYRSFDGVLAMYHDQGLIPFKHISRGEGINFTAGVGKIRTSPAHGTAFNLAGKQLADPTSMRNAIYLALDLARKQMPEIQD